MKPKVIAIVIAVVITAGTATGVGVAVNRNNDKQTEELVSAAVSEALATVESTTVENTTESTTAPTTVESTTTKAIQKAPKQETTTEKETTTAPQIVYDEDSSLQPVITNDNNGYEIIDTPLGTISVYKVIAKVDSDGEYWETPLTYTTTEEPITKYNLYIDENNKLFYHSYIIDDNHIKTKIRVYPEF